MPHLYQLLQHKVSQWRRDGYPCTDYPAIAEILEYAQLPGTSEVPGNSGMQLRFLRAPQLQALETYWYLRLVEDTPHIFDLYRKLYPEPLELLAALGMHTPQLREALMEMLLQPDSGGGDHNDNMYTPTIV